MTLDKLKKKLFKNNKFKKYSDAYDLVFNDIIDEIVKELSGQKFELGERQWCSVCCKRIIKFINRLKI